MMFPGGEALVRALLAQRLDPLLRQAGAGVTGPQPLRPVGPVVNDPRLPSRAALERQAAGGPLAAGARETRHPQEAPLASARSAAGASVATAASSPTQLSAAARTIATLLDAQALGEPLPVRGAAPLWSSPAPPPVPELARTLARAVAGSGLFHEAHLRQFAQGTRTLAQLHDEPQGRLAPVAIAADAAAGPPSATAQADAPAPIAQVEAHPVHAPVLHPGTLELVQQQFQLLASGVFRWSGEPWPGARMDWQLSEDPPEAAREPAGRGWTTRLRVALPSLGEVDAVLGLDPNGALQVRVGAADAPAARELQAARSALLQRFEAAGFSVQACRVEAS
jgi:hypothetical protein